MSGEASVVSVQLDYEIHGRINHNEPVVNVTHVRWLSATIVEHVHMTMVTRYAAVKATTMAPNVKLMVKSLELQLVPR